MSFIKLHPINGENPVWVNSTNIDWIQKDVLNPDEPETLIRLNRSFDARMSVRETPEEILALLGEATQ